MGRPVTFPEMRGSCSFYIRISVKGNKRDKGQLQNLCWPITVITGREKIH